MTTATASSAPTDAAQTPDATGAAAPKRSSASARLSARARRGVGRAWSGIGRAGAAIAAVASPVTRIVWARISPFVSVVSVAGWIVLAVGLAAVIAGLALGWEELLFIGVPLLAGLVVCAVFLIGRSTYAVAIELKPPRVVVGARAMGRMLVTNNGEKPLLPVTFQLPVGAGVAEFAIPGLKPGEEHEELFAVPTNRRAVIVAGPARSVRGDQLGLLRRVVQWADPVDLFVHPVTTSLAASAAGLVRDLEGQPSKKITSNDLAFHALRAYEPGDDRRYVHWRTSARTGQLMVRQFEETRRSQLTILLSENVEHYASEDEFELAVSMVASIGQQVVREGTKIAVVAESRLLRSHTPGALLDDTSRLALGPSKYRTARDFGRALTRRLPPPSVAVIVSGSRMQLADHRAMSLLFPADATVIAITASIDSTPKMSRVSEMQVLTIGGLSDLPHVLARAAG